MSVKELQEYTYYSRYARYNEKKHRRETWGEAVDRVMDMHLKKYPEAAEEIEWVRPLVKERRLLGSQRALQFGGEPILKKHARLYNCTFSYCDRIRFFQETLWLLLCGCGVGFSVQKHHVDKLPGFKRENNNTKRIFSVGDSIEGWSDALGILIGTYIPHPEFSDWLGYDVQFDFSQVRPAGSSLSSGVGKAPGPEPLRRALEKIRQLLDNCIERKQTKLRPIDAYDVLMHASDAVLSGGVRRSATIALFSPDDDEMMNAKTGNWFYENPQRARSNNSVLLVKDETNKESFNKIMSCIKEFGEPGFVFADNTEVLVNPCVEISGYAYDEEGNSGFQMCNLTEINGKKVKCKEDFALAARGAAILGTLQAGYTDFDYLGKVTESIVRREALLGVSITGMMDNPDILFDPEMQKEMARLVVKTNEWMAKKIGINAAARTNCIKPSGSTSCILGSSSGVHPHHAKRYFRRVQGNVMEPVLQHFQKVNPLAVDNSVWNANGTDKLITFCVEVEAGAKTKNQIPAIDLLEYVKLTQQNWVAYGKVKERCVQPWLTHNVSNTINVRPDEWESVTEYIFKNKKWFAGISLIPQSGDLDYPQAPMVTVHSPREILQNYGEGALFASGLIVDGLHAFGDLWKACDAALGLGEPLKEPIRTEECQVSININSYNKWLEDHKQWECKMDWIRRIKQFADRYCGKDLRRTTYLLKDTNNWKLWMDLRREYKDVDYTTLMEYEDNTQLMQTVACAGGKCEII